MERDSTRENTRKASQPSDGTGDPRTLAQTSTPEVAAQSGFLEVSDGKLYYEERGSGPAVVFIHGFTLDRRMWGVQVSRFSHEYKTIVYDVRGFGRSSIPATGFSHHDDLAALLDSLQHDKVHLVGYSMGGRIALNFALHYPERLSSLAVFGSNLEGAHFDLGFSPVAGDLQATKDTWLRHELFASAQCKPEVKKLITEMVNDYSGWHWSNTSLENPCEIKAIDRVREIQTPALVVVGDQDLRFARTIADRLEKDLPNVTRHTLPGCGHTVTLEAPERCNELLAAHWTAMMDACQR